MHTGRKRNIIYLERALRPGIYRGEGRAKEHGEVSDLDSVVWQDCTANPILPRNACIVPVEIGRHILQIRVHSRCKNMARKDIGQEGFISEDFK